MFGKFNAWYDTVQEPKRFFIFLFMILTSVVPIHAGVLLAIPLLTIFGLVVLLCLIGLAATRVKYLSVRG